MKSVLIGQIVNVHGIKGEVKVYPYTDDVDNLSVKMKKIYLDENLKEEYKTSCRVQKGMLLVKITGISILTEFAVSICKDMGESSIASKVDLGGKLLVISLSIPVISATLNGLLELLQ